MPSVISVKTFLKASLGLERLSASIVLEHLLVKGLVASTCFMQKGSGKLKLVSKETLFWEDKDNIKEIIQPWKP